MTTGDIAAAAANSHPKDGNPGFDECLKACGFGRFHIKFLLITMLGCTADVAVANTTAFLLPSAECDLNMNLVQKGVLNAASYSGMMFSTVLAGFLTDTFGRKIFVQLGYGGIFLFTFIAGTSQTYGVLLAAKFFGGVLFATSFNATISLTGELCHSGIRDRVLLFQASFTAVAQISIAAVSWAVLMQDWEFTLFDGRIALHTWSFYLFVMSLWSLFVCILYTFLIPESPKYLLSQKKYTEAREILIKIFKENTRQPADMYPYKNLWASEMAAVPESASISKITFYKQLVIGLQNAKPMFRKPLVGYIVLLCINNFLTLSLYNIVRLWFPQVSTVVEHYATPENEDLCAMLDAYAVDSKLSSLNVTVGAECIPVKSGAETYINSMIIGSICIFPFFLTSCLVNKVGKKALLTLGSLTCFAATLGLRWVRSKVAVVALFAVDTSISQMMSSINLAFAMELFPTRTSTLAVAMIMMSGRIGTLAGNVTFPMMLELSCGLPFFFWSGIILCVILVAFLLPKKKTS